MVMAKGDDDVIVMVTVIVVMLMNDDDVMVVVVPGIPGSLTCEMTSRFLTHFVRFRWKH